jgi:hypothetical protein
MKKLKKREKTGRPSIQEDQPMLLQTIIDLATCEYFQIVTFLN